MRIDGKFNAMFGLPSVYWINTVKTRLISSRKVFLFCRSSVNFLLWSGEGSRELKDLRIIHVTRKGKYRVMENQEVTSQIIKVYNRSVFSYAEDKIIFRTDSVDISKASKMTAHVWQFYKKYVGFRKTDYKTFILDLTYTDEDLGETILGRNAVIRINIKRHIGYLHILSTFIHELAHFLENRFCEEDHGNTFFCLGLTLINIIQCSDLDLTEYGISPKDVQNESTTSNVERSKCPAMVFAQIGGAVPNAVFSLIGGLFGALTYGMLAHVIERTTKPKNPVQVHQIHKKLNLPYIALALPMAAFLCGGVAIIEWLWPTSKDLNSLNIEISADTNVFQQVAWPPYIAGILVGLCQVPLVLVLCDTLGGSSCYATVVSQWVVTERLQKMFPYLARCRGGLGNWWQVLLVIGVTGGAVMSAGLSSSIGTVSGVSIPDALVGGVLMLWGSRFASGCTSGHGISGMGLFAWLSFLAVPSIFAGGISTAFLMKYTGVKDHYVTYTGGV